MSGRRRPSAALVISIIALVVALAGSAIAASHFVITSSRQIKPGAIKGKNLAKKTVKLRNLASGARTGPRGPAGPIGPAGAAGADGAAGPTALPAAMGARAELKSPTVNVSTDTIVPITLGTVVFDTGGFVNPAAAGDRMFAPKAGVYTITAGVEWDRTDMMFPPDDARLGATLVHRSSAPQESLANVIVPYQDFTYSSQSLAAVARLEEGDSVAVEVFQDTGDTLKLTSIDKLTFLSMVYNGP